MSLAEAPMIIFTLLAQLSVGAFVTLGVIQLAARRFALVAAAEVDRITSPAAYAVGATLVAGLGASMLHLHDVTHMFNVLRHTGGSWLSNEIVMGMAFATSGFLFALLQWRGWGSPALRQTVAAVTALLGLGLVFAMSMVYMSLTTVPAWHTWYTPFRFFRTALLLGALAVGAAFMLTVLVRLRRAAPGHWANTNERRVVLGSLRGIGVAALILLGLQFVGLPLYLAQLNAQGPAGLASMASYQGAILAVALMLSFAGAGLFGAGLIVLPQRWASSPRRLALLAGLALVCVLLAEVIGRALFYESMVRVGI